MEQDKQILLRYKQLSYFEREQVIQWIKKHFFETPTQAQMKNTGLQRLLAGDYSGSGYKTGRKVS